MKLYQNNIGIITFYHLLMYKILMILDPYIYWLMIMPIQLSIRKKFWKSTFLHFNACATIDLSRFLITGYAMYSKIFYFV